MAEGLRPFIGSVCKKVIVADYVLPEVIRPKIATRPNLSPNVPKKLKMAKEKGRLVVQIIINFCTMKLLRLNPRQEQQEELQSNSRQSLDLEQKRAQINREGVTGDLMPPLQVELGLRVVPETKIISHEITQTPHLKTSKEQWSRIRTL